MTEENKPGDPTEALNERVAELDGLIDQLNQLTDRLHDRFTPDSPTQ